MPLYEYRCSKCGNVFEVIQKFADAPLTEHPDCGGSVERLLSTSALQFKGSGWYVNDYAKKSPSSTTKSETKSEGSTESKPAESKPATTTTKSE